MARKLLSIFFVAALAIAFGSTQSPPAISLELAPDVDIPLSDSSQYFGIGGGLEANVRYQFPHTIFFAQGGLDYAFSTTLFTHTVSLAAGDAGAGVDLPLAPKFHLLAFGKGGYWYGTFNDETSVSSSNLFAAGGAGVRLLFSPSFSVEAGAQYLYFAGLYQGLSAGIGTIISLGGQGGPATVAPNAANPAKPVPLSAPQSQTMEFNPTFSDAFPVFYKYYDDHPIGQLDIANHTKDTASNVRLQFYVKQYMDEPKEVDLPGSIAPGDTAQVNILALFTDTILNVTEGTKSAAELVIDYDTNGQSHELKKVVTVTFLGRNAMTWDDNRKAAAYVTAKDPQVLSFARSVTSAVQNSESRSINQNIQAAIALHEALDLYGLNYVPNPTTPYSEVSKKKDVIDFLQFPRETFSYKSGDCSDLSILYSSLLQAVGIDTAFITIPGHIFVAFTTALTPEQASAALIPESEYIAYQGKVWLPVEITMRHQGFLKAWELGAKEWNENNPTGQAGFYPVQEAWKAFQPVGLPGAAGEVAMPATDQVLTAYKAEAGRYVDSATLPQIQKLQAQIQSSGSLSAMNSLGVLYAKYGQSDKAESEFKQILTKKEYLPALLNIGNLYFIQDRWKDALQYYQQALDIDPGSPHVILAIAKTDQQLANFDDLKARYDQLKKLDPNLAEQYAYLGAGTESGGRASDIATERRNVLWEGQ